MSDESKIQESVRILAGNNNNERVFAVDCEVISVDEEARTCQVRAIGGKARNTFTARLMSSVDDGIYFEPETDSTVCVVFGDFTAPFVCQYSGIEKIVFRGGDLGGLVKVIDLTEKLNNLEDLVNDLIEKYNAHTHAGVQAGGSSTAVTTSIETGTLVKTEREDIENKKIKQG